MDYPQHENSPPISHYEYVFGSDESTAYTWVRQQAFSFMNQLEGWCPQNKAAILVELVLKERPDVVVEIGVYGGKSLIPVACALRANEKGKIIGIDPWDSKESIKGMMNEANRIWWFYLDHEAILRGLVQKIRQFNLLSQIELVKSTSAAAPLITEIDILNIDGNYSDEASFIDVTKWVPLVKSGGWVFFEGMNWYEDGICTTARAVEWLDKNCSKFAEFKENSTWGIWIKP